MMKVYIDNAPFQNCCRIWFIEETGTERLVLQWDGKFWKRVKADNGVEIEPTLLIPFFWGMDFLKIFADAINNLGIKPDSVSIAEGELKAVKVHLEDMRRLVFRGESRHGEA